MKRSATTPPAIQGQQPASNPFPKIVYGGIVSAFGNNIYGIRRASFVANAGTTDQAIISPNGTCSSGLATPTSFILSFGTQQATDSYGLTIAGGPGEPDPGNIFTQNVGPSATSIITGFKTTKGKGGRKLPWVSNLYAGKGIQGGKGSTGVGAPPAYGTFPIPDPKNPGSYIAAPGSGTTADAIVTAPEIAVELLTVGGVNQSYLKFGGDDGNGLGVDTAALETKLKADGIGGGGGAAVALSMNGWNSNNIANAGTLGPLWGGSGAITLDHGGFVAAGSTSGTSATAPTKIIAPQTGTYCIAMQMVVTFSNNQQGEWNPQIFKNGTSVFGEIFDLDPSDIYGNGANGYVHVMDLAQGDALTFNLWNNTTGPLSAFAGSLEIWMVGGSGSVSSSTTMTIASQYAPSSSTAISNAISWGIVLSDNTSGAIWTNANPTRLIAPSAGVYLITANAEIGSSNALSGSGTLGLELYKNGNGSTPIYESNIISPGFPSLNRQSVSFSVPLTLAASDYLELSFGTNFNPAVVSVIPNGTTFSITKVG